MERTIKSCNLHFHIHKTQKKNGWVDRWKDFVRYMTQTFYCELTGKIHSIIHRSSWSVNEILLFITLHFPSILFPLFPRALKQKLLIIFTTHFNGTTKDNFSKHIGKRWNCIPTFPPFPTLFSTLNKKKTHIRSFEPNPNCLLSML